MSFEKEIPDFKAEGTAMPQSKLEGGFVAGDKIPANWLNYLLNRITQGIKELQEKSFEATSDGDGTKYLADDGTYKTVQGGSSTSVTDYTVNIPMSWSADAPYTQTVTVTGILETDVPIVDVVLSDDTDTALSELEAYNCVSKIETSTDSIILTCYEECPTIAFNVQLRVVK